LLGGVSADTPTLHKPRLEALSDGVVAVVMTLLVLELKIDHLPSRAGSDEIWHALRELKRPIVGYVVAFAYTALFWYLHHLVFALVRRINGKFVAATLTFLLTMSFLPFSVSLYMRAPTPGAATMVYFGNFTAVGLTLLLGWLYAVRAGLTDGAALPNRVLTMRLAVMALAGAAATIGGYFSVEAANLVFVIIALIAGQIRRRLAKSPLLAPASPTP
jgi:uncharacterized membrane protein